MRFRFSDDAAPLVFDLKENYYSFQLRELSQIRGKYALIMIKIWESNRRSKEKYTTITGSLEEWQTWFLEKEKRISPGQFYQQVIVRAVKELEAKLSIEFSITTQKRGRKVEGYEIMITDTSIKD